MFNSYVNRFNKIFDSINSDITKTYAHLDKQNSFTRKRKMPLAGIIYMYTFKKRISSAT